MRNFKNYFMFLAVFGLLFTSCSKDEDPVMNDSEKATLSFGAILNDLAKNASSKQAVDYPACSDDDPAYVSIILLDSDGNEVVGNSSDPFEIDLVAGQVFTEEVPELQLTPGQYVLDHFAVYNATGDMIWLAPKAGGFLADFVNTSLPVTINLGAGVKKYVDVSVLCYDQRDVNQYGYMFFDFDQTSVINFCIFGNYCDETGRHYPAAFSVDVWRYADGAAGDLLYSDRANEVTMDENGDYAGTTVCVNLPDEDGVEDQYYFEITLLNSDAYGTVTEEIIRSGVITDADVRALYNDGTTSEYYHFREGACTNGDSPDLFEIGDGNGPGNGNGEDRDSDGDGVVDGEDQCPDTPAGVEVYQTGERAGCPIDTDGDGVPDYIDNCPNEAGPVENNGCPEETGFTCTEDFPNELTDLGDCGYTYLNGTNEFVELNQAFPYFLANLGEGEDPEDHLGDLTITIVGGDLVLSGDLFGLNFNSGYELVVTDNETFCETLSVDRRTLEESEITDEIAITMDLSVADDTPLWIKARILSCPATE